MMINKSKLPHNSIVVSRDPLMFDLDSSGLETLGIDANNSVLFNYDGNGIKVGTGWIINKAVGD